MLPQKELKQQYCPNGRNYPMVDGRMPMVAKRSSIQAAELVVQRGKSTCDRDRPVRLRLTPVGAGGRPAIQ